LPASRPARKGRMTGRTIIMKKFKSSNDTDPRDLEARIRARLERKLRGEIEKDLRMSLDGEVRKSVVEDIKKNYSKKVKDLETHIDNLRREKKELEKKLADQNERIAESEQRIGELERQINSADMKRVFIHNDFKNRLFELLCEIAMEQMEFSKVTRNTLVEERILHLTQKNPLYKNAKETKRREMRRAAEDEALSFYDSHYKSHGLFLLYGDVFSVLKEDHSKAMTVSDREERLLESLVPSNIFISEEGAQSVLHRLAPMDGAICLDTFGTIQAAGRYIIVNRGISSKITPYTGFGSKNITSQGITRELHNICAITLSGRSKKVRLFENGEVVRTFEPESGKLSYYKNRVLTEQYFFDTSSYFITSEEFNNNFEILNTMLRAHFKRGKDSKTLTDPFITRLKTLFGHTWQTNASFRLRDGKELRVTLEKPGKELKKVDRKKTARSRKSDGHPSSGKQDVLKVEAVPGPGKEDHKKGAGK